MRNMVYKVLFLFAVTAVLVSTAQAEKDNPQQSVRRNQNARDKIASSAETRSVLRKLPLPKFVTEGQYSLEQVIDNCCNAEKLSSKPLSLKVISQLLWAGGCGMEFNLGQKKDEQNKILKNKNVFELYIVIRGGVYFYDIQKRSLDKIIEGDIRWNLGLAAAKYRSVLDKSACIVVLAGSEKRLARKCPSRAKEQMYFRAGEIMQNIRLQGLTMGLVSSSVDCFDAEKAGQLCKIPVESELLHMLVIGYPRKGQAIAMTKAGASKEEKKQQQKIDRKGKNFRALIIVPEDFFSDKEYFDTIDALDIADVKVDVAGERIGVFRSDQKGIINTKVLIDDVDVDDYDAIILISGRRVLTMFKDSSIAELLIRARARDKIIGAIGRAARALAEAGIVKGYRVTGDNSTRAALVKAGADFTNATVQRDNNIVTAQSSRYVVGFVKLIVNAVRGRKSSDVSDGRYVDPRVQKKQGKSSIEIYQDAVKRRKAY